MLVLEEPEHAQRRGARIFAETARLRRHLGRPACDGPDPTGEAAARAMQMALADAGICPTRSATSTRTEPSTPLNDARETRAIKRAFGEDSRVRFRSRPQRR